MKKSLIALLLCAGLFTAANAQQPSTPQQPTKAKTENTKGHEHHAMKGDHGKKAAMKHEGAKEKPAKTKEPAKPAGKK